MIIISTIWVSLPIRNIVRDCPAVAKQGKGRSESRSVKGTMEAPGFDLLKELLWQAEAVILRHVRPAGGKLFFLWNVVAGHEMLSPRSSSGAPAGSSGDKGLKVRRRSVNTQYLGFFSSLDLKPRASTKLRPRPPPRRKAGEFRRS